MYSTLGAIHIHSEYSDGSKSIEYITQQAKKANLDWIIITDHNTLEPLKHEGYYDGVCVIAGCEITPPLSNHLLAFDIQEPISETIGERNYIDEVHKQNGFCFVAHPDENIYRKNRHKPLRWDDWSIDTFDGLEIWNYLTDWNDRYSIHKNQLLQVFNRHKTSTGPTKNLLDWWDRLNNKKEKIVPAICGLDAHAFSIGWHGFLAKISDYYDYMCAINNNLILHEPLSKDYEVARTQILNAVKNSNNIILNRKICKNTNIEYYVSSADRKFYAGECAKIDDYSKLVLKLPAKATVRILINGVIIFENDTKYLEYEKLTPGKIRVEVFKNGTPWIFTNPIKLINSSNAEQTGYSD